jgi:hypothetical protein
MKTSLKRCLFFQLVLVPLILTFFLFTYSLTFTEEIPRTKIVSLPDILEPSCIAVDKQHIYIIDRDRSIFIYSTDDFRLIKRFGRMGEGPGEFSTRPVLSVFPDILLFNILSKMIYFTLDGEFKKEIKIPFYYPPYYFPFVPVGDNFVGFSRFITQDGRSLLYGCIYDKGFQLIKRFYGQVPVGAPPPPLGSERDVVLDCIQMAIERNKIFIADSRKSFHISVFDSKGKLLYEIHKDFKKLKVTKEYKNGYIKKKMENRLWERVYSQYKYKYKQYFPPFFSFKIDNEKIYLVTYTKEDNLYEIIVMNLKGDIIKRTFSFPLHPYGDLYALNYEYDIHGDKIFHMSYNYQTDVYELLITEIK